jgi:DNA-binding response OmpR family regulator
MFQLKTMLIVVDDPELAHVLVEACRRIGLYPQTAQNVMTATARIYRRKPDVVCVDAEMPSGDGLALCGMLASTSQGQKVPVIVLTDCREPEAIRCCGGLCAYYVRKAGDLWSRILPVIYELVEIEPIASHVLFGWDEAS